MWLPKVNVSPVTFFSMTKNSAFPIPKNEEERLAELTSLRVPYDVPLAQLQYLCELAARIAEVPVSLVSLVDADAQKFAANVGLEGVTGTPRDVAFCAHAIMSDGMFVIGDATKDPRFSDNALVTGAPEIRAYAGKPLATAPGIRVGTLCAIDFKPRHFSHRQIDDLETLGKVAAELLTSHRAKVDLADALERAHQREAKLDFIARHDGLTGLLNATAFKSQAKERLDNLLPDEAAALILLDADNFKTVNDRYGHTFGDTYLTAFADALKRDLPEAAFVGRLGGDEFAAFVPDKTDPFAAAANLIASWRSGLRSVAERMGKRELGRASIGVAIAPEHGSTLDDLYKYADIALYASKENGRNRTTVYQDTLITSQNIPALRSKILAAIDRNEFVPYYQPKVDLKDRSLVGFEILCRWQHATRGPILPQEFTAIFRDRALSPQITRTMFTKATQDLESWKAQGLSTGRLALNVTAYDLTDPQFVTDLERILHDSTLSFDLMTIEVTETVVMGNEGDQVFATLKALQERGARIALDDFGTGYASLKHFRSWPIDSVKLDHGFISNIHLDKDDLNVVKTIVELAQSFGMLTVAEGIEVDEQAEVLREIGCNYGQGYLFGRPAAAQEVSTWLRSA